MRAVSIIYFCIKYILPAKPGIVNQIILLVAKPRRRKNFRHLTITPLLHFPTLYCTRPNHSAVSPRNSFYRYGICILIARAPISIIVGCPEYIDLTFFRT